MKLLDVPGSQPAGHGTTGQAKFWKQQVADLLQTAPHRGDGVSMDEQSGPRTR